MFNLRSTLTSPFAMRLMFFSYLAMVVILVTSCQKNQDDNQQINTTCVNNPNACQSGIYNQTPGFTPYNYNGYGNQTGSPFYNNGYYGTGASAYYAQASSAYLCNCPYGSMPTYNNFGGLGCVQSNLVGGNISGYASFGYSSAGANNNQWVNIPQISNVSGYSNNGCYNGVIQSCIVTNQATCAVGYTCRPTSGASALGLCVSNSANSQTGQIYR